VSSPAFGSLLTTAAAPLPGAALGMASFVRVYGASIRGHQWAGTQIFLGDHHKRRALSEGDSQWNKLLKDCLAAQRPIPTWVDVSVSDGLATAHSSTLPLFLQYQSF
jgi:hypothetical protein